MKVGDLVRINQSISEYAAVRGDMTGVLVELYKLETRPALFSVLWSDGQAENLYSDELEMISESR